MIHPAFRSLARAVAWIPAAAAGTALVLLASVAAAQSGGTITGQVTSAESAQPVAGATVTVPGTARGAVTDDRGHYRMGGLLPGSYQVAVVALGFQPRSAAVTVTAGGSATADFVLPAGSFLLPGLVVSATRTPTRTERVAATTHVLTREQVRTSPARTPDDLLREMPGVELPRTSGTVAGPEQIVSIRGMDEGRTLVLLDNVPLNDPWGEWVDWQRAPVYDLERVELTEGGGSSLYGNYAMGGVIQLVSRPIEPHTVRAMASAGNRGLREGAVLASDVYGPLALSVNGSIAGGGGYVLVPESQRGAVDIRSGSTRRNANVRAEYALRPDRALRAHFNVLDEDRSAGTPLSPGSRRIAGLSVSTDLGGVAAGRLSGALFGTTQRQTANQTITSAERTTETLAAVQTIPAHDIGGSLQWSKGDEMRAQLSLGGDFRSMHGRLNETDAPGSEAATSLSAGGSQLIGGIFLQAVVAPVAPLRVEASVRADGWRNYSGVRTVSDSGSVSYDARSDASLSPRLAARLVARPGLTLRGSVYRAFRAPTLSEQYRNFIAGNNHFLANPQLGPEHLTGADAGVDWQPVGSLELRATVFINHMDGLTDFAFLKPGYLMRRNEGSARSRGVEGEAALRMAEWLRLSGSYNYDDARTAAGARVHRVPLQRAVARLMVGAERTGQLAAIYRHEGSSLTLSGAELDPFDVVDLSARREILDGLVLVLDVENLTDQDYLVNRTGNLEQIGLPRTLRLGLSWTGR